MVSYPFVSFYLFIVKNSKSKAQIPIIKFSKQLIFKFV